MAEREPEVEEQDIPYVDAELHQHRLVQPVAGAQILDVLGRRAAGLPGQHLGEIAGRELQQEEAQRGDAQDHRHRLEQPPEDVAQQAKAGHGPARFASYR